ncbi:hypothetical protein SISSUDRAFT_1047838 [Sistotremastrum suecicum HHB10207 ss-3]|uniref:Transcription and mRNA export factor SUS1 n=1 Tax=Sistotremastrum suecicum HHB10207 ss-3 TaxID=1314776 RepID=A0A166CW27_9AGAM|nr:hypothetical protein SISSUDRAFT_1047838 [Sistotremastrum suecicum HHB10207 ss-3]
MSEGDATFIEIHKRFTEKGEWDKIITSLLERLNETGWVDSLRDKSKESARSMETLRFEKLMETLNPHAQGSVPEGVRAEFVEQIRKFLESQIQ